MQKSSVNLSARLVLIITLLVSATLAVALLHHYVKARDDLNQNLTHVANAAAERLARQLVEPLWSINEQQVNATLQSEMSEAAIASVAILDPTDKSLLFEQRRESGRDGITQKAGESIQASRSIVSQSGEAIGVALVEMSQPYMKAHLMTAMTQRGIELAILGGVLILLLLLVLQLLLFAPLSRLTQTLYTAPAHEVSDLLRRGSSTNLVAGWIDIRIARF